MKKSRFIVSLLIVACFLSLVFLFAEKVKAVDFLNLDQNPTIQNIEKTKSLLEEQKWEYLSQEWQKILLKNKFISMADGFFKKIDVVFFTLTGEHYSISLTLLLTILIAFFFFYQFSTILRSFSVLSPAISVVVALLLVIISAQAHLYSYMANFIFKLIFYKEGVWRWIGFAIFFVCYILLFILLKNIIHDGGKSFLKRRENMKKAMEDADKELFKIKMKGMERSIDKINKGLQS